MQTSRRALRELLPVSKLLPINASFEATLGPLSSALHESLAGCGIAVASRHFSSAASSASESDATSADRVSCQLKSRGVVGIDGPDAFHFLQGIFTNDVYSLSKEPPPSPTPAPTINQPWAVRPPVYTAMLSPQGRVLFDIFLFTPPQEGKLDRSGSGPDTSAQGPAVLVDVDASLRDEFLSVLKRYKLRANVTFEDLSSSFSLWSAFTRPSPSTDNPEASTKASGLSTDPAGWQASTSATVPAEAQTDPSGYTWHADPRLQELGFRALFPAGTTPPLVEADSQVQEGEYRLWRYQHGVAEGAQEIHKGDALPLEFNLDALHGVSYEKGCYVGQELTARTHHRGIVRKRLMPIQLLPSAAHGETDASSAAPSGLAAGAEVMGAGGGAKPIGTVLAVEGSWGLAHLRLGPALEAARAGRGGGEQGGGGLAVKGHDGVRIRPVRPEWWPETWGHEEGA